MAIVWEEGAPIDTKRILTTLDERRRWEQRRDDLETQMRTLSRDERARRKPELERIVEQIAYYDSLLKQMKRELRPADRSSILSRG